jgi:hypothetical protein
MEDKIFTIASLINSSATVPLTSDKLKAIEYLDEQLLKIDLARDVMREATRMWVEAAHQEN